MAKKFFYVCAGVFLLALAYHLGATSATAQGPAEIRTAAGSNFYGFAIGHQLHLATYDDANGLLRFGGPYTIPGSADVVGIDFDGSGTVAFLSNGEVYRAAGINGPFVSVGSMIGPTETARTSWGAVKQRYR